MLNTQLLFREIKFLVDKQTVLINLEQLISFIAKEASEGFFIFHLGHLKFFSLTAKTKKTIKKEAPNISVVVPHMQTHVGMLLIRVFPLSAGDGHRPGLQPCEYLKHLREASREPDPSRLIMGCNSSIVFSVCLLTSASCADILVDFISGPHLALMGVLMSKVAIKAKGPKEIRVVPKQLGR